MAAHVRLSTNVFVTGTVLAQRGYRRYFANAGEVLKSGNLFNPSKSDLAKSGKLFQVLGPKAFLQGSAVKVDDAPKLQLPEVAFVGRTSVGKSSLINALLNQRKLVRTSKRPGHTKLVHFFNVGSKFYLVDLPGYGYVERQGQGSKHFVEVAEHYLKERTGKQLKSVCLLVDANVGLKRNDLIALEMLEEFGTPFQVVCTKVDRLPRALRSPQLFRDIQDVVERHTSICFPHIFAVSAKEKTGLSELQHLIALTTGIIK